MTDKLVLFMPSGRRGRFPVGTNLLDAARSLGVYVESVCGGRGLCGRCQIEPAEGVFAKHGITSHPAHLAEADIVEEPYRARGSLRDGRRLACAARVLDDLVIDVPAEFAVNAQVVRKRAETRAIDSDPTTRLVTVTVPEPDMAQPLGDADRLLAALGVEGLTVDPAILPLAQRMSSAPADGPSPRRFFPMVRRWSPRCFRGGRSGCSGSRSTSAPRRSPAISSTFRAAARSPRPARRTRRSATARI